MESIRAESMAERRFLLILIAAFGGLALLLASVGVYGVMTLVVSERTQEVGVRLALGAEPSPVLAMIVRQAGRLAGLGVVIGLVAAAASRRCWRPSCSASRRWIPRPSWPCPPSW